MSPRLAQAQPEQPLGLKLSRVTSHTCAPGHPSPCPCCLQRPLTWRGVLQRVSSLFPSLPKKRERLQGVTERGHLGVRCPPPALGGSQPAPLPCRCVAPTGPGLQVPRVQVRAGCWRSSSRRCWPW